MSIVYSTAFTDPNLYDKMYAFRKYASSFLDPHDGVFFGPTFLCIEMLEDETRVLCAINTMGVFFGN